MKYSDIALKVLAAKECGIIKSNAQFWTQFSEQEEIETAFSENDQNINVINYFKQKFISADSDEGVICAFDNEFPVINQNVKNSDRPFLLFYKGDITLLSDLNENVAVIGLIDPTVEIEKREIDVVKRLVNNNLIVVSGLAKGCDTIAHKVCVDTGNKTIAILPTQINKISPAVNRKLAKEVVDKGGLLLTEYYKEANTKHETIGRYIERDRLQAMFSKTVILIASYRKGEGDSGSRHAMEAAKAYGTERYVMYNEATDSDDRQFGLNKDLINSKYNCAKVLQLSSIEFIKTLINPNLVNKPDLQKITQLKLF